MFSKKKKKRRKNSGFNAGLLAISQFASGRSCDRPTRSSFSVILLRQKENAEFALKFHVPLHFNMQPSQW
jgi:hypothetical protein